MSQQNIIKELIGLQDVIVNNIEQSETEIHIYLELERKEHAKVFGLWRMYENVYKSSFGKKSVYI